MPKTMTNVKPYQLNYNYYTDNEYDRDIVNVIPFHEKIHELIASYIHAHYKRHAEYSVLDLGTGTGITSKIIGDNLPNAQFDLVDFSARMLKGAKKRFGTRQARFIEADYSTMRFDKKYDIILTVIGLHHQSRAGKARIIKKIYGSLKPGGIFILGDLMTCQNKSLAAANTARHYHHMVEKSTSGKILAEWAYHHLFLNELDPIEDHIEWLKGRGFRIVKEFNRFNTALIIAKK